VDTGEDYERCQVLWEALGGFPGEEALIAAWRKLARAGHPLFREQG
jgi:hypothetical protein